MPKWNSVFQPNETRKALNHWFDNVGKHHGLNKSDLSAKWDASNASATGPVFFILKTGEDSPIGCVRDDGRCDNWINV